MRMTEKGQVTIPSRIGKKHGLNPGAEVKLIDQPNGVLVVRAITSSTSNRVVESLLRGGTIKGRTEDWLRLTRSDE